ncbi:hypothetical protein DPMN_176753 [Dreissena polymorpha]|uniref:Mab-21-like HhH/H2TH-like domain-containing protein n=1 Tax=Dreissena polymorpha TaxID=45954 RepID=A0A9D4EBY4_DREPO|nr:hypothetical protein DPMN_176753 [Dreissena polymorpha]
MVQHRRAVYRSRDEQETSADMYFCHVTTGSMAQGFASIYESAHDTLLVDKHVVCVYKDDEMRFPKSFTVFSMHEEYSQPGYFCLKAKQLGSFRQTIIKRSLLKYRKYGDTYISSEFYKSHVLNHTFSSSKDDSFDIFPAQKNDTGNGMHLIVRGELTTILRTPLLRCVSTKLLLQQWISRPRKFLWPSRELIDAVCQQECHVLPVCSPDGKHRKLEWRVHFTMSELKLTDSWSQPQYKLFVLLKIINRTLYIPIHHALTSYMIKHVLFWMFETEDLMQFTEDNVFEALKVALEKLLNVLKTNKLQHYLTPEINLYENKMDYFTKQELLRKMEENIEEGADVLKHCPRINEALYKMTSLQLREYGSARDKLETLRLVRLHSWRHIREGRVQWHEGDELRPSEQLNKRIYFRMNDIVWPEWREYSSSDLDADDVRRMLREKIHDALA